jgi:PBP1b-binding outer membrane lipoprotein LpoB
MRRTVTAICLLLLLNGCNKYIEEKKENIIIDAMTSGQWVITSFVKSGSDITSSFESYKFQYYSNRTVDAIKNGTVENTGTWDGDVNTMTTWANFKNASAALALINGSWHIDNNSWTYVVASQTSGTETKLMRLEKK